MTKIGNYPRVAVVGSSGFLGTVLCRALRNLDCSVIELPHGIYELTDPTPLPEGINIMVHAGGNAKIYQANLNPRRDCEVNVTGTLKLLEVCNKAKIKKFVYISTTHVYQDPSSCPNEQSPVGWGEASRYYGLHKLMAEDHVRHYSDNFSILRPSALYGPGMKKNVIVDMMEGFKHKQPIHLYQSIDSSFDYIHVEDVVTAIMQSFNWSNIIVNVAQGEHTTSRSLYNLLKEAYGGFEVPIVDDKQKVVNISIDNSKLLSLGYKPNYTLEKGIKGMVNTNG